MQEILLQIDHEIAQLQQARAILGGASPRSRNPRRALTAIKPAKKRNLTPEGRKRIAEAVRLRWARQKGERMPESLSE
jgi:hypothetical protein